MRFRAGSWPWLLAHEVRLAWRGFFSDRGDWMLILLALLWLILHAPAYIVMRNVSPALLEGFGVIVAGLFFWFAFTLVLSSAIMLSVNALYDRGDLDLLISSPLSTSMIFAVRGLGVAVSSIALVAGFALPFAHMGIVHGHWGFVAVYPTLAGVALGAAGLAFALTLLLARWLGARRTRVVGQLLSVLIGASIFLTAQIPNLLPADVRARLMPRLVEALRSGWLAADSPLWLPVRALFGDPLAVLGTVAAGAVVFVAVTGFTSRAFVSGTQESTTKPVKRGAAAGEIRFRPGLATNIMRKEALLILRDPNLIAKTLLQGLYLVPLIFVMARNANFIDVLGPGVILLLAGITGNLAWITIAGEQAPDLIGSAPVNREKVRWLKAASALRPLVFIAAPFIAFYLLRAPRLAPIFVAYLAFALLASAVTQVWGGKPSPHRDLRRRQRENVGLNFAEVISSVAIAGSCYLTFNPSWWLAAVLPVGLLAPGLAWTMRRRHLA